MRGRVTPSDKSLGAFNGSRDELVSRGHATLVASVGNGKRYDQCSSR